MGSANRDHWIIDLEQEWVESLSLMLTAASPKAQVGIRPRSICRVPMVVREANPTAYTPKVVSLGPYHHNRKGQPKDMDHLKLPYAQNILSRNPAAKLEDYLRMIKGLEGRARSSYSDSFDDIGSNEFAEMMLLDGCFILRFLLMHYEDGDDGDSDLDPVRCTTWASSYIMYDMFMLENQIPFFILESLFLLATASDQKQRTRFSLVEHILGLFGGLLQSGNELTSPWENESSCPEFYHILHLLHSFILPVDNREGSRRSKITQFKNLISGKISGFSVARNVIKYQKLISRFWSKKTKDESLPPAPDSVLCATRLKDAGVKFKKKNKGAKSCLDVAFRNGTIEMPTLEVYDYTSSLFHNLIAFEQCFKRVGSHVSAYATLMDCLVDRDEDVALLHGHGCIVNGLGSDDAAANLFNQLCREVAVDLSACYLAPLFISVNKHCDSKWNQWRAVLMRDYFHNPWVIFSLFGAAIVIFLTIMQTVYSLLTYYHYNGN